MCSSLQNYVHCSMHVNVNCTGVTFERSSQFETYEGPPFKTELNNGKYTL